jgi:RHS repeat-associated protein
MSSDAAPEGSAPLLRAAKGVTAIAGRVPATEDGRQLQNVSAAVRQLPLKAAETAKAQAGSLRDAPSDPAPEGSPPLRAAADGVTAVAGRVLATEDATPLQGVVLRMGAARATTDQNGLFLLEDVVPGEAVLVIDGRHPQLLGTSGSVDHGVYEVRIRAEAGRTNQLPWVSWLPRVDHEHDVNLASPALADVVAGTPAVPGLELHVPKGAILTGIDGEVVRHVGLTAIPVNRPPFPLPRNVNVPVYFTAQPGGAVISGANGEWLGAQVVYPNYNNELPKARGLFWRYEPDSNGWSPYGMGTVTADARQVMPDPGTRIYALSGAMFNGGPGVPPPYAPPPAPPSVPPPPLPDGGPTPADNPSPPNSPPQDQPPPPKPQGGDPADLATGLYVQRQTDLYADGVLPLAVTRTYRPGDYNRRAFGVGMSLTYSMAFHSTNQYQVVDLIMPDGGLVHYTRIINPANPTDNDWTTAHFTTSTPGPFYGSHIEYNGNGWNLTRTDGVIFVYGDNGPLQYMTDRFGNKITLGYSNGNSGNIVQVSSSTGRFIRFSYDGNNCITQAVDNIGRTVSYTYDSSSRLSTVTDPDGGVTTYSWDSANRVQSIQDARGVTFITNAYDTSDRLVSQTLADGAAYNFSYTPVSTGSGVAVSGGSGGGTSGGDVTPGSGAASGPPGLVAETDVTDPRGFVRKVTFNAAGYVLTDRSAMGTPQEADWSFTRDPVSNFPVSTTEPLGRRTDRSYDANGNVLSITRLAGTANAVTTSYTYDPVFNRPTSVTDPLGHVTTYLRDGLGQVVSVTDPLGNTTSFTHNQQGQVLTATDPLNNTTQFAYSPDSDLTSVTDPLGRVTRYYTDAIGRLLTVTDASGGTIRADYDPINGPNKITDANGATTTVVYMPGGRVASVTDPRNANNLFTYDSQGWLATQTDALNAVTTVTARDGVGNVLSSTDRKGQAMSSTYDALNRLATESYADGSMVALTWDLGGRLTTIQDSIGGTITRSYDDLDRLTSEVTPQGTVTYTYDAAGRRLTMQAGSQTQVTYSYDSANRLTGITQGSDSYTFGYDTANRRTSATLPGVTVTYGYDVASELSSISYASGSTQLGTLTYGYDASGHINSRGGTLFQSVLPAAVVSASYDLANRLTSRTVAGVTASPTWDGNGNLTSDGVQSYTWDARNRLTGITSVASFSYDRFNRRQTVTRNGTTTSFLYDGWNVQQEQQGGSPSADLLSGFGLDERYSRAGLVFLTDSLGSAMALANGATVQTSYGYDAYGVTQITGAASTNAFQFTGRENDNTGLYNYRNRYYNPAWGRFVSEDSIGLRGGMNGYVYALASPANNADATGNCPWCIGALVGGGLALGQNIGNQLTSGCGFDLGSAIWDTAIGAAVGAATGGVSVFGAAVKNGVAGGAGAFFGGLGLGMIRGESQTGGGMPSCPKKQG